MDTQNNAHLDLNRLIAAVAIIGLAVTPALMRAQAGSWRIDPLHSSAQFSVRHMMISTVRGHFGGVKGVAKISRKEFGILYNPIMETGGVTVSDEVSINLDIELIKN